MNSPLQTLGLSPYAAAQGNFATMRGVTRRARVPAPAVASRAGHAGLPEVEAVDARAVEEVFARAFEDEGDDGDF